ncbi:MAG: nucleoside transporter C-terminal domain-containing protein, partial [Planctomycetota bacterium]|nr:nucleoside transporter C-terminal domain-containing protein [Planctomycetota bacterium]
MGVPWEDCANIGELLGIRMVLNEFVSYIEMGGKELSPRAYIIATYAFCGFANFSSIAIQIGGISSIAPNRRQDLAKLGLRAMFAATLASFLTATVAGALLSDEQMERDYYKNQARVTKVVEEKIKHYDTFLEKYPNSQWAEEIRGLKEKAKSEAAPAPTPEIKTEGSE